MSRKHATIALSVGRGGAGGRRERHILSAGPRFEPARVECDWESHGRVAAGGAALPTAPHARRICPRADPVRPRESRLGAAARGEAKAARRLLYTHQ